MSQTNHHISIKYLKIQRRVTNNTVIVDERFSYQHITTQTKKISFSVQISQS